MTIEQLREQLNSARKNKNNNFIAAISGVIAAAQVAEKRSGTPPNEAEILKIISKERDVAGEQIELAKAAGQSWVDFEIRRDYLEGFLPKAIDFGQYETIALETINKLSLFNLKDMGKVLREISQNYGVRIDNGKMAGVVKSLLR